LQQKAYLDQNGWSHQEIATDVAAKVFGELETVKRGGHDDHLQAITTK